MVELLVVGFVAGVVCGISPCVLPVLPVILASGAAAPAIRPAGPGAAGAGSAINREAPARPPRWRSQTRPVSVVAGLVVSFSVLILAGSEIISALGLPQGLLRDAGIALLIVVGVSFLFSPLSVLLERPFARISARQPRGEASGFVLGLGLGLVFVPCAGPILSAVTLAGAKHDVSWTAVFLTLAFGLGLAIPFLVVAVAGSQLTQRARTLRRRAPIVRQVSGAVILLMAVAIAFGSFSSLQRDLP